MLPIPWRLFLPFQSLRFLLWGVQPTPAKTAEKAENNSKYGAINATVGNSGGITPLIKGQMADLTLEGIFLWLQRANIFSVTGSLPF